MAPSISNGNKNHNLSVKNPDGTIKVIPPGKSIAPKAMAPGKYEIASVEIVPKPLPNLPPPKVVTVTNVGQETVVFICPSNDDYNFILVSQKSRVLADAEYVIHSIHIPPTRIRECKWRTHVA